MSEAAGGKTPRDAGQSSRQEKAFEATLTPPEPAQGTRMPANSVQFTKGNPSTCYNSLILIDEPLQNNDPVFRSSTSSILRSHQSKDPFVVRVVNPA
jgi:hypothetical protein